MSKHNKGGKNKNHQNRDKQEQISIKGMHCRSCEILIEDELKKIPEITQIKVNHKQGLATIKYQGQKLSPETIEKAIQEAGYDVGNDDRPFISTNLNDYKDLIISLVILIILYYILKTTGIINLKTGTTGGYSSLPVVLLVGLTAGFSTCMALVGGLVLGISARHAEKHPEATPVQKFRPHLFFILGRIVSFFILGGLVGVLGSAFQLSGQLIGVLTIVVGFVMITLGLQLTEIFPRLNSGVFSIPKQISQFFGVKERHEKEYSHKNSMIMGGLTFFLPCGFTQAMQLFAMSSGKFSTGALVMGIFAIGTAPGLLGIGGLTSVIKGAFAKKFFKFAGLVVIVMALVNINNGLNLTGWKITLSNKKVVANLNDPNVKIVNGFQEIRMTQNPGGYSPNTFTIRAGIPSKWIIDAKAPDTCAGAIMSGQLGIKKILQPGENIIEFTPNETGEIKFSCLMGMYRGTFIVVENDLNKKKVPIPSQPNTATPPQKATPTPTKKPIPVVKKPVVTPSSIQVVKTVYTLDQDIQPSDFQVKAGKPVSFEVEVKDDGQGCMSTIMIPGLVDQPELLEKGKTLKFEFTPDKPGVYQITCAMGVPRGTLSVN